MNIVWFVPEEHVALANATLDSMGHGPRNLRRRLEDAEGAVWYMTAFTDPSPAFIAQFSAAKAGAMGPDVQAMVNAVRVYPHPDPALPLEDQEPMTAGQVIAMAMADMGVGQ